MKNVLVGLMVCGLVACGSEDDSTLNASERGEEVVMPTGGEYTLSSVYLFTESSASSVDSKIQLQLKGECKSFVTGDSITLLGKYGSVEYPMIILHTCRLLDIPQYLSEGN